MLVIFGIRCKGFLDNLSIIDKGFVVDTLNLCSATITINRPKKLLNKFNKKADKLHRNSIFLGE